MAFFSSPAKPFLIKRLNKRKAAAGVAPTSNLPPSSQNKLSSQPSQETAKGISSSVSTTQDLENRLRDKYSATPSGADAGQGFGGSTSGPGGASGVPNDPEEDIEEAVREIKAEVEARRRRGSTVRMPTGRELKQVVEEKIGRKL